MSHCAMLDSRGIGMGLRIVRGKEAQKDEKLMNVLLVNSSLKVKTETCNQFPQPTSPKTLAGKKCLTSPPFYSTSSFYKKLNLEQQAESPQAQSTPNFPRNGSQATP